MHIRDHAEDYAKELKGNWRKFQCFAWRDQPDDSENFAIVYTHNRDSGLLEQSNAAAIEKALEPFTDGDDPDVRFESHGHWAVGHVDGFAIRVVDSNGEYTPAFLAYVELACALSEYPVLDESDYSQREHDATLENIEGELYGLVDREDRAEVADAVFGWLWENDQSAIENHDDQGGYPTRDEIRAALDALEIPYDCDAR